MEDVKVSVQTLALLDLQANKISDENEKVQLVIEKWRLSRLLQGFEHLAELLATPGQEQKQQEQMQTEKKMDGDTDKENVEEVEEIEEVEVQEEVEDVEEVEEVEAERVKLTATNKNKRGSAKRVRFTPASW